VSGFGSPFTFTGELLDANDLLYLRARYYSPALGVFMGLDPVENGNRYQYVGGNVINQRDPAGLQDCGWPCDMLGIPDCENLCEVYPISYQFCTWAGEYSSCTTIYNYIVLCKDENGIPYTLGDIETEPKQCVPDTSSEEPCPCATCDDPSSFRPFAGKEDMLCNLERYNGATHISRYGELSTFAVRFFVAGRTERNQIGGLYLAPYWTREELIGAIDSPDRDLRDFASNRQNGGIIIVRQPISQPSPPGTSPRTRAYALAALVEEITHAGQYYSLFPGAVTPCESLTPQEAERHAKTLVRSWAASSGIAMSAFGGENFEQWPELLDDYPDTGRLFRECPGEGPQSSVGCVDPLVAHALLKILL
jgi:RHS repeat-associated protein